MGISIEKNGIVGFKALAQSLMTDILANGFTEVGGGTVDQNTLVATFEAGTTVDPLQSTQPWRLRIEALGAVGTDEGISVHAGTETNLPNDRTIISDGRSTSDPMKYTSGNLEYSPLTARGAPRTGGLEEQSCLWNESDFNSNSAFVWANVKSSYPLAYRLSISNRGIAVCMWVEGRDGDGDKFSWFVIQRPVNNANGQPLITGRCPVFAVWGVNGGSDAGGPEARKIWRMTVREADVTVPTAPVSACFHTKDNAAVINPLNQAGIAEGNQFVVNFPHGFNTDRYLYREEVDMLAYTSADVISQYSSVDVTLYGEASARTYSAMNANGADNTGMRILLLTANGGI